MGFQVLTGMVVLALAAVAGCDRASPGDAGAPADPATETTGTAGTDPGAIARGEMVDDETLTTRIRARYFQDDHLKGRRIDVIAQRGVVTLRGEVGSDNERAQAMLLAWTTPGVEHVEDALAVSAAPAPAPATTEAPPAVDDTPSASQDAGLEARVRAALDPVPQASAGAVQVTAKDGIVLLEGTLQTAVAKQRVLSAVRKVEGVVQVVDRLRANN